MPVNFGRKWRVIEILCEGKAEPRSSAPYIPHRWSKKEYGGIIVSHMYTLNRHMYALTHTHTQTNTEVYSHLHAHLASRQAKSKPLKDCYKKSYSLTFSIFSLFSCVARLQVKCKKKRGKKRKTCYLSVRKQNRQHRNKCVTQARWI